MKKGSKKIASLTAIIALMAVVTVCLVACNASSYQKRLEKAGYIVIVLGDELIAVLVGDVDVGDVDWAIMAVKVDLLSGGTGDRVTIIKFKKTADANDAKKYEMEEGMAISRSGNILIVGTTQGVKDAK